MEGLILGGAYIRWEFCVTRPIGLASGSKVNFKKICVTVSFLPCFTLYLGAISKYKPPGAYIREGRFNGGIFALRFGGLIHGGAYFRNFTVSLDSEDGFLIGCRNVSRQQQSFSGLQSPR